MILCCDEEALRNDGVVTASAGNMGQGVAFSAEKLGCKCTVVVPDNAPQTKVDAMVRRGAEVKKVPYARWWEIIQTSDIPEAPGFFFHPVCDQKVMAGNATIGLEILEDVPDVDAVIIPYGGGALCCGVGAIIKEARGGECAVFSCEPETAAPMAASLHTGEMRTPTYEPSFVDGCGGKSVLEPMWPLAQQILDQALAVTLDDVASAIKTMVERNKVVAEGAGACPVAAAMFGDAVRGKKRVVCVVSGGGLDSSRLIQILQGLTPPP